mmetsp:Transcript_15553/g.24192  ORF Transcript_15553/g.24192 Transcript_15553/m.24192 type:complete len:117 (-) Transcript_15553:119-469(-)
MGRSCTAQALKDAQRNSFVGSPKSPARSPEATPAASAAGSRRGSLYLGDEAQDHAAEYKGTISLGERIFTPADSVGKEAVVHDKKFVTNWMSQGQILGNSSGSVTKSNQTRRCSMH